MLKIYITRHGQDEDNAKNILNGRRDTPLTDTGREQALELGLKIKEFGLVFEAIYSSPLIRAFETAEIISKTISGPIPQKEDLLIERDFGIMTGKTKADIIPLCAPDIFSTENITYFLSPKDGETFPEMMDRAGLLLEKLNKAHASGNILLVCHGDTGKIIYSKYYNLDWKTGLSQFHLGNGDLVLLSGDSPAEGAHMFEVKQYNS